MILEKFYEFMRARRARGYLVGGTIRDSLLRRPRYDVDVSVPGDAIALARAFADQIGGAFYVMDDEFDVARVIVEYDGARSLVDFARLRGERIEEDLATRDFTINAMAADISHRRWDPEQIIDPFNGRDDLEARRIRAVSGSVFDDDPVRLLRAVRFEATLGLALEPRTEAIVRREARKLVDASPERLRDEFYRILAAPHSARQVRRLDDLRLLEYLLPEVTALKGVTQSAPHYYDVFAHTLHTLDALETVQRSAYLDLAEGAFAAQLNLHFAATVSGDRRRGALLRLGTLLHDVGKPTAQKQEPSGRINFVGHERLGSEIAEKALRRLRFSNEEIGLLAALIAGHMLPMQLATGSRLSDLGIYRYFRATGAVGVDIAVHAWCDLRARSAQAQPFETDAALQAVIARLLDRYYHARETVVEPPALINGRDVIAAVEIPQGPLVGRYLEAVREAQATGRVTNREQALEFVRAFRPDGEDPDF